MPQLDSFATTELAVLPDSLLVAIDAAEMPGLGGGASARGLSELLAGPLFSPPMQGLTDHAGLNLTKSQTDLCLSGLWLLAGDLDQSHSISQDLTSAEGSFWHGIMHRREADFGNAKFSSTCRNCVTDFTKTPSSLLTSAAELQNRVVKIIRGVNWLNGSSGRH
jgi:hypothetical protein